MWVGDAYYADADDPVTLRNKKNELYNHPSYQDFRQRVSIIGTWDDHDFGINDGTKHYPFKAAAQTQFLDFLDEPADSPRRRQAGVYTSYMKGDVKIILLDVRYHRDPKSKSGSGDVLGAQQWQWLENELTDSTAKIHLIASGSTITTPTDPNREQWNNYPQAKARLFKLLENTSGVAFLTGDRHFSGVLHEQTGDRKYLELMSSGLTHTKQWRERAVRTRAWGKGNFTDKKNFSTVHIGTDEQPTLEFITYAHQSGKKKIERQFRLQSDGGWRAVGGQ